MSEAKVEFVSAAWIDAARQVLTGLAAEHGEAGQVVSVSEAFTNAPRHLAGGDVAAWHFAIDGKTAQVEPGENPDADIVIRGDYEAALPGARLVYTPKILAEMAENPPDTSAGDIKGDMSLLPAYISELHNRLAVITA